MEASLELTLLMVITVGAGITAQVLAEYLQVPGIVFLLMFGILLGPDGLDILHPNLLGSGLDVIVALSVAVILFEGGFNLELREMGQVSGSLRNLVLLGTWITLLLGGVAAHWLSEFPWPLAFLYASLVVVTGPTVISPLLKQVQVDRSTATLLEGEGVLVDPLGAILAVVVLNLIISGTTDWLTVVGSLATRLGIGAALGVVGGGLMVLILQRGRFLSEDLKNLVVLAGVWGLFGLGQMIRSESGLMATVVAGLVLRGADVPEARLLRRFKGQLTVLAVSVLFILLAADLSLDSLVALGWGGSLTVLSLMFLVRPLSILVCTWGSGFNWRQKLFLAWVAPRGIVAASVASLFALILTSQGINGGDAIKALVFLTIIMTVFLQGLSARFVAQWLGITSRQARGAVIVGCHPLSCLVARLFQEHGELVVLIDTDAQACQIAWNQDLKCFLSSALETEVLEQAGLPRVGTFLAMTSNGEVNQVLAQRAVEEFSPPRVLAVFPRDPQVTPANDKGKIPQAFVPDLGIRTWNQYLEGGEVKLGETTLADEESLPGRAEALQRLSACGKLLPLVRERGEGLQVVQVGEQWQVGDRILFLFYDPKPQLLKLLAGSQHRFLLPELIPEVEQGPDRG